MQTHLSPYLLRRHRWMAWLLMAGVICSILAYGLILGRYAEDARDIQTLMLLALPGGLLASLFVSQYFRLSVLLIPLFALAVPYSFATGTESRVPASLALVLLLTGIWCASMYLRGWKLVPSPLNRPLLVFGAVCIISLFWGIIWRDPVVIRWPTFIVTQIGSLLTFLASISAALLIGNFVTTKGQLKYIVGLFLVLLAAVVVCRLTNFAPALRYLNDAGLWGMWLVTIVYGLLLAQPGIRWYWRAALLILLVVSLNLMILGGSKWLSGWVPAIVAIFAVTLLHSRRAFFVLLIAGALVYQTEEVRTFLTEVKQSNEAEGSTSRLQLWELNLRLVQEHWLLGTGPAGYAIYYMTYNPEDARSTHNNYFDIAAQFGVVGFVVWFWLAITVIREGCTLIQRAPPGFLRTLAIIATAGWISALVGMFFGDWVLPFAYNVTITGYSFTVFTWIFVGTLICIRQLLPMPALADADR